MRRYYTISYRDSGYGINLMLTTNEPLHETLRPCAPSPGLPSHSERTLRSAQTRARVHKHNRFGEMAHAACARRHAFGVLMALPHIPPEIIINKLVLMTSAMLAALSLSHARAHGASEVEWRRICGSPCMVMAMRRGVYYGV